MVSHAWVPAILLPLFTWPVRTYPRPLASQIPPTPKPWPPTVRLLVGKMHWILREFSIYYCQWVGIPYSNACIPLPFGLALKWSDGTLLEEVLATKVCRAAGIPTPIILSYGDHPDSPHAPVSFLMTRLPGRELRQAYPSLSQKAQTTALEEMKLYLATIRGWKSPWGDERICSITGGPIRSLRVPNLTLGPFESTKEFHEHLLAPVRPTPKSDIENKRMLASARKLQELQLQRPGARSRFTHGDLKNQNILVDDEGHITGFLDWETAGWCSEFWEYTTAHRQLMEGNWWSDFLLELGVSDYLEELESDRALLNLTVDAWSF